MDNTGANHHQTSLPNYFIFSLNRDDHGSAEECDFVRSKCNAFTQQVRSFFQFPASDKQSTTDVSENNSGYFMNTMANKQQFQFRMNRTNFCYGEQNRKNYEFCEASTAAFNACLSFCKKYLLEWLGSLECYLKDKQMDSVIVKGLEVALNQNENYWQQFSVLLATEYLNTVSSESCADMMQDNCPAHTDAGIVTLCIAPEEGLQLYDEETRSWIDVSGPDKMVLFFGDSMAALTNNAVQAVRHKVVPTPTHRFSVVFKLRIDADIVGPRNEADYKLLQQIQSDNEKKYRQESDFDQHILEQIFFFLPYKDLCNVELVCKHWQMIASSNFVWRAQCMTTFGTIGINVVSWKHIFSQKLMTAPRDVKLKNVLPSFKGQRGASLKLVVVGDGAVGKTCMLISYANNMFPDEYIPTVFDEYSANIDLDGRIYTFSLWDTAGQPDYARLRPLSYPDTNVFLILFDVTSKNSFDNVKTQWTSELALHTVSVPFILVGTKIDLRATALTNCISYEQGVELAQEIQAVAYFEVSSKNMAGVSNLMGFAARVAVHHQLQIPFCSVTHEVRKNKKCIVQ